MSSNLPIPNRSTHMNFLSLNIYLSPHPIIYIHTSNNHFLHHIISQLINASGLSLIQELLQRSRAMRTNRSSRKGDSGSRFCGVVLLGLILLGCIRESCGGCGDGGDGGGDIRGKQLLERPCDEIYVVGEGETLHSISHKCSDPFIVERNPHIHDPDDVYPGLVIKIIPTNLY